MGIMYNVLNKMVQKRRSKVVRNVSFQGSGSAPKKIARAGLSLVELTVLIPTAVGLKVANRASKKSKKVAKEGAKIATTGKSSSKTANLFGRIGKRIGMAYMKQATGYNDLKRSQKATKLGLQATKGAYGLTKPLLNKSLGLFVALGTSFTSAVLEHKINKLQTKKLEAIRNEKLNRASYQELKNQFPEKSQEELAMIQKEISKKEQEEIENQIQNLEEEYDRKINNDEDIQKEIIKDRARNTEKIYDGEYKNLLNERNAVLSDESNLEAIFESEKSKMFNPNLYLESKRLDKFDTVFSEINSVFNEEKTNNLLKELKVIENKILK